MFSKRAVLSQFRPPVTSLGLQYVRRSFKASSGTVFSFARRRKGLYITIFARTFASHKGLLRSFELLRCELGSLNYRALAMSGQSL